METMSKSQQLDTNTANDKLNQLKQDIEHLHQQFMHAQQSMLALRDESQSLTEQTHKQTLDVLASLQEFTQSISVTDTQQALMDLKRQQNEITYNVESISLEYLGQIKYNLSKVESTLKEGGERWERASNYLLKQTAEISQTLDPENFKRVSQQSCRQIEKSASRAISTLQQFSKQMAWKNLLMVTVAAITASIFSSWYLTDQYPWETHRSNVEERQAGKALIQAWPNLDHASKAQISRYLKQKL